MNEAEPAVLGYMTRSLRNEKLLLTIKSRRRARTLLRVLPDLLIAARGAPRRAR